MQSLTSDSWSLISSCSKILILSVTHSSSEKAKTEPPFPVHNFRRLDFLNLRLNFTWRNVIPGLKIKPEHRNSLQNNCFFVEKKLLNSVIAVFFVIQMLPMTRIVICKVVGVLHITCAWFHRGS